MTNVLLEIFLQIQTQMWHSQYIQTYDVIEHRHEDNSPLELILVADIAHELLDFADKFHSNSIGSPSIMSKVLHCDELFEQRQSVVP